MRVLHVISGLDPQNGGPTMVLTGMTRGQAALGLDVSVLATWREVTGFPVADQLRNNGIKVRHVGKALGKLSWHRHLPAIANEMIAAADIVHIHAMWEEIQYQSARVARRRGVPYVITPHGMLDPWNMSHQRLAKMLYMAVRMRRILNGAAAIHFATELERDAVARLKLRAATLIEPFGLDLTEFEELPPPGSFRARYPQLTGRPLIVFLGRLHAGKGLELLIPALAQVTPPQTMLAVVGPDSNGYLATAQVLARRHGVLERIVFTGMLHGRDRVAALADADLVAQPSFHENFGIAVAESLAAGTPVIISDQVYLHPLLSKAGVAGVVPTRVEPLAAELTRWLEDGSLRADAAARARPFAFECFDWRNICQHWVEHYRKLIGK